MLTIASPELALAVLNNRRFGGRGPWEIVAGCEGRESMRHFAGRSGTGPPDDVAIPYGIAMAEQLLSSPCCVVDRPDTLDGGPADA